MLKFQTYPAWILSALFILAGSVKLFSVGEFESVLHTYQLFPTGSIPLIAATLPWLEIILGAGLLFSFTQSSAALGVLGLNIAFILVLVSVMARSITISCGCFGVELLPVGPWTLPLAIMRDVLFAVMAGFILHRKKTT